MMIYHTWEKMRYIYMKGICSSCDARLLLFQLVTMISVSKAIYLLALKHTAVISLQPYMEIACRLSSKLRKHFWKLCSFTLYNTIIVIRNTQLIVTISTLKLMVWGFFRFFFFLLHGLGFFLLLFIGCFLPGRICLVLVSSLFILYTGLCKGLMIKDMSWYIGCFTENEKISSLVPWVQLIFT